MSSPTFQVLKTAHTGLTVTSISRALEFWHTLIGAEILYQITDFQLSKDLNIVGVPDARLSTAMLRLADGHQLELLEYSAPSQREHFRPRPCDVGSVHVALEVKGSKALIEEAEKLGWRAVDEPQVFVRGDGKKSSAIYMFGPDGEAVELMEILD